jgi:UDP-N-acetylmuramoyl-tripeptide--D-alanyl-D-alanine ligase
MIAIDDLYKIYLQYPSVTTDTRNIKNRDIFFALKGPSFNGNTFAEQAFNLGAAYCICDEKTAFEHSNIIYVADVLKTLQQLAKYHRETFSIPFIAITGSNGKTTTKELVHAVLSKKYKCYTTVGNLNNHIGVPLTILSIKKDAEIAVIEMGANHLQEIASYCNYTLPTHGLIGNCGKAHLEGFGGIEGVKKGKGELYDFILANNGTIFINNDYDYLVQMSAGITKQVSYGTVEADYVGIVFKDDHFLEVNIIKPESLGVIKTNLAGNYNLANILSAIAIGKHFDVPETLIKNALEEYIPTNSRSQIIKKGTNTILLDAYNANPSSMKVAIENFAAMQGENKIVILGGMMELGSESILEHEGIVQLLQKYNWDKIVLTGNDYKNLPANIIHFNTSNETAEWFKNANIENAFILIKGSRGMAMEKILQ